MNGKAILASFIVAMFLLSSASITVPVASAEDNPELPSSFDQRDLGIVTPPKFQNPWGACWSFGGTAAAETAILTMLGTTWEESGLDLSEKHVTFFANNYIDENVWPSQAGEGFHIFDQRPNMEYAIGGSAYRFSQLFSSGVGPMTEEHYPYKGNASLDSLHVLEDPETTEQALRLFFFDYTDKSIEETIAGYSEEQREQKFSLWTGSYRITFPEGVNASNFTASDVIAPLTEFAIDLYTKTNAYYKGDDWSIDRSERNLTEGYTMLDGNFIEDTRILDGHTLVGVNWEAVEDVKSELYKGHGLVVGICFSNEAYNSEYGTLYECRDIVGNHMIQLVGWDDDYPAENFSWSQGDVVHTPEGDGAWLCKNNWGSQTYGYEINGEKYYEDWGIKDENGKATGFFWVSYYDWSLQQIESLSFTDKLANENGLIYLCYDYLPDNELFSWTDESSIRTSNVFTTYCGELDAVSIKTFGYDSDVTVRMYLDVKDSPESGKLIYEEERAIPYAGIHVLYLDDHIGVRDDQILSVVVEERTSEGKYIFGVASMNSEEQARSDGEPYYGVGIINEGESFLYKDGAWIDWSEAVEKYKGEKPGHVFDNFGIKVFEVELIHEETNHLYNGLLIAIIVLIAASALIFRRKG